MQHRGGNSNSESWALPASGSVLLACEGCNRWNETVRMEKEVRTKALSAPQQEPGISPHCLDSLLRQSTLAGKYARMDIR